MSNLPLAELLAIFAACAGVIWIAGVKLADTTDILSARLHFGAAFGGIVVLAIATNLPEIAITASAAWAGEIGVAVGNILGGIAIQTVVIAGMDAAMRERAPLTHRVASLTLVIEATTVVVVLIVAIMATQLPPSLIAARLTPDSVAILLFWLGGVWLASRAEQGLPWHAFPAADARPKGHSRAEKDETSGGKSTARVLIVFAVAAAATLVAGVLLERSGDAIAGRIGMSGVLFGATLLAAATALPELSTGIASVRMEDYKLAVSDILGGNAFLPVLFLLAVLISNKAVLPRASASDIYLAGLGILLTCVYVGGLIFRPKLQLFRMGVDSLAVILLYVIGIVGLFAVASTQAGGA